MKVFCKKNVTRSAYTGLIWNVGGYLPRCSFGLEGPRTKTLPFTGLVRYPTNVPPMLLQGSNKDLHIQVLGPKDHSDYDTWDLQP